MTLPKSSFFMLLLMFVVHQYAASQQTLPQLKKALFVYTNSLELLHSEHPAHRPLPGIRFFLFGMGNRKKMLYKNGCLIDAVSGDTLYHWQVKNELIVPSEYYVYLKTIDNKEIHLFENEKGVYIKAGKKLITLSSTPIHLPNFKGYVYAPVLKVLHHEILINIINGKPVPNFFVYQKPWYRDATLMAMVLRQTGNLHLVKDWIMAISDPFDRNNHGYSEADNLGEVLFLVSLVSDASHRVVKMVLDSTQQFIKSGSEGSYIDGKTDYASHPVFQTKWLKYGFKSLHLADSFRIPRVYDSYSSLFWWDYKKQHVTGAHFDEGSSKNYPYLVWAEDHFFGEHKGMVSEGLYPLSWEAEASDAYYPGIKKLDGAFVQQKLCAPHTWHAAEMFLLLIEK